MTPRAVLALAVLVAATLLMAAGADAQAGPTITVTPATGLEDGQTVSVTGAGFDPGAVRWAGTVCLTEVLGLPPSAISEINAVCGAESLVELTPNPTGTFSTTLVVHQVQRNFTGGSIDCGQAGCLISFVQLVGPTQELTGSATAAIRFGPPVPQSKAECKNGGWRGLANEESGPFRNQGQCVNYVVAHRR